MTIWLAALYSLGIIGASAIFLAAGMHFFGMDDLERA